MTGIVDILFKVLGGLGIFLYGMESMSEGMKKLAGEKLKKIISALTTNRVMALLIGVIATVIVQSSSVTTVMVIGFVNAQLMNLSQALGVILGAKIGTTVTGWVLVLNIGKYGLPMAGLGAIINLLSKDNKRKNQAILLMGIGMIFFGLELMSEGFRPLRTMPEFVELFQRVQVTGLGSILAVAAVGAILTAIVQSSSATLGITISLVSQGLVNSHTGLALVLGLNVGTTITAFLASIGAKQNAKKAAYAHTIISVVGILWILPLFNYYDLLIKALGGGENPVKYIAIAHTVFNVVNAMFFLPLINPMIKFLHKVSPEETEVNGKVTHMDSRILETPVLALDLGKNEIMSLDRDVRDMLTGLREAIGKNMDNTNVRVKGLFEKEEKIDLVQKEMFRYLRELLKKDMIDINVDEARNQLALVDEYESLSDYVLANVKLHLKLRENGLVLNGDKKKSIYNLQDEIEEFLGLVIESYRLNEKNIMIESVNRGNNITINYKKFRDEHITRMIEEDIDPLLSSIYMEMLSNYRKIKNHTYHIAEVISGEKAI